MNSYAKSTAPRGTIFIRIAVGLIFSTQGILKYTDARMGVERFTRIGFPHPSFTVHFVGVFEIMWGFLMLFGVAFRIAAVPLLIIICTAIVTTKIPAGPGAVSIAPIQLDGGVPRFGERLRGGADGRSDTPPWV